MREEINIIRCTCDVCKVEIDVKDDEKDPLVPVRLPMTYGDFYGGYDGFTVAEVEMCDTCLQTLLADLEKHYEMHFVPYGGVSIERKEDKSSD